MRPAWIALAALLTITLMTVACQKIGEETVATGPLQVEKVAFDNAMSLQYGELISVTANQDNSSFVLWFVRPDKTIVAVAVSGARLTIATKALLIPRR